MQRMLFDIIPKVAKPYLDDIGVKGPTSYDDGEEVEPGIRRFMLEHVQNLDQVLERIERAGATIGPKSQLCMPGLKILEKLVRVIAFEPAADLVQGLL